MWIGFATFVLHALLYGEDPPWASGVSKAGKPIGKGIDTEEL
jgi:hypothetical protein